MSATHISATISSDTKSLVENYSKKSGVKKGFLIEEALLHHLQALKELPADIIIPAKIMLTEKSMSQIINLVANPQQPTPALTELMRDD
ncbi:MAG: hypothetical protein NT008_04165 [Methylococcales bacterium]|jgi:uncharacterized protein (DUF1778 family)|nr:hypothetical protein [Methylococcales bacterium]